MTPRRQSRSGRTAWAAFLGAVTLLAACESAGEQAARERRSHDAARVGGTVISTVDGQPITLADVQDLVDHSGLRPDEALRRLQAERLLMIEAERREFDKTAPVYWVALQARVQALLEATAETASVTDDEIEAAYDKAKSRFELPERRVAVHVLAKLPRNPTPQADAAARAFAAETIGPLGETDDVQAFLATMRGRKTPYFEVAAESLPAFARDAALVVAFRDAMFALPSPGAVRAPIRTPYGWHAIRVVEIQPASKTPYAQAAEQLRAELLLARKKQLVDELLAGARKQHGVQLSGEARKTLAKLEL